jgi:hypothetical protein
VHYLATKRITEITKRSKLNVTQKGQLHVIQQLRKKLHLKNLTLTLQSKIIVIISKNSLNQTDPTYLHDTNFTQLKKHPTDTLQNKHNKHYNIVSY